METSNKLLQDNYQDTKLLEIKLALYEALYRGDGINGILAIAEQYFKNPIFVCDVSYNIIAASSLSKNMPYGIKHTKEKTYLDTIEIESMKRYKLIENIYNNTDAFCSVTPDHSNNPWIFCAIRIQNIVAGHLGICYTEKKPTNSELALATVTAQVISVEMQKHEYFTSKTGLKYEYFLTYLLEGQFEDIETIQSRLHALDRKLYKYLCIIALSCDVSFDNTLFNKEQMEQLRSIYSESMSLVYKDHIVLFISQKDPQEFCDDKLSILIDFLSRNHVKAGISQIFTNPMEASIYYKQSIKTLETGKAHYPDKLLFRASEMMLFNLLSSCERSELKSYYLYQIKELQQYDSEYNTELTATLKAYLKNNRNTSKTSEHLHIHRSTLFYRLKKIEELLSFSMNDSSKLFFFELSFGIQDYINSDSKNNLLK